MSSIYLGVFILTLAGLVALGIYSLAKRRRELRMQLRLLHGRSQLLSEEIDRQKSEVEAIDEEAIDALRQQAEEALNMLNIAMVERQAHLLNYSDLAHLQHCKSELLETIEEIDATSKENESPPPTGERAQSRRPTPQRQRQRQQEQEQEQEQPSKREHKDRSQIENQLLGKIGQLNKAPNKRK